MKHTIVEDQATHQFAIVRLPPRFADGDTLPIPPTVQWFATRDEAVATLSHLFDEDE